jgi:hypothetical protein
VLEPDKASFNLTGVDLSRKPRGPSSMPRLEQLCLKYKDNTMLGREGYVKILR